MAPLFSMLLPLHYFSAMSDATVEIQLPLSFYYSLFVHTQPEREEGPYLYVHRNTYTQRYTDTCTHRHTQTHTHPCSKAIEGRSLMEAEVRSSSLLAEVYQWGPIKECLLCMFQKICCYDADSGPCETEDISQKNRSLGRN